MKRRTPTPARLRKIRLILMDVDGVMTDGSLVYTNSGEAGRTFNVKDGYGVVKAQRAGLAFGIITGKASTIVRHRARVLGIREVYQGVLEKEKVYDRVLKKLRLTDDQVAYIGDDEPDIAVLKRVGFSAAPADAVRSVRAVVQYVCRQKGGHGAVREIIDLILTARGE